MKLRKEIKTKSNEKLRDKTKRKHRKREKRE